MAKTKGFINLPYPIKYRKGYEAIIITDANGYENFFYPDGKTWDYDGGGQAFNSKGKPIGRRRIEGTINIFFPVKSIKIGGGGKGLTIVDAKNKTYKFS